MKLFAIVMITTVLVPLPAKSEISTKVDKSDDQVELTVCSRHESDQFVYRGIHVQQQQADSWKYVRHHIDCPCDAKCRRSPIVLQPGECKTHRWDRKISKCNIAEAGHYRFIILGDDGVMVLDNSSNFEID